MNYIIPLLVLLGFTILNYKISKSIGYPAFLFSLLWFLVILVHFLCIVFKIIPVYELSLKSLLIFVFGVFAFTFGGIFITYTYFRQNTLVFEGNVSRIELDPIFDNFLFWATIFLLPFYIKAAYVLAIKHMIYDSYFAGLRSAFSMHEELGLIKYAISIAFFNFFIRFIIFDHSYKRSRLIISLIVLFPYLFLTTGRTYYILFISLLFGIQLFKGKIKFSHVFLSIISFLLAFFLVAVYTRKGGSTELSLNNNFISISHTFLKYFTGPVSAFDAFINQPIDHTYGLNNYRFVQALFYKIGISDTQPVQLVKEFVRVPFYTNVYTLYRDSFEDFGITYTYISLFIFSSIHTFLFYRSNTQRYLILFLYAIMIYPLIMSFFQEQYFSLMPIWLQYILILLLSKRFIKS